MTALEESGIQTLVCDSTNASVAGHSVAERDLYSGLRQVIGEARGRVVVACFGTNIARLKTLTTIAEDTVLNIHTSGHPAAEELKQMYRWIKPEVLIPVHGESEHLTANSQLAREAGIQHQIVGCNGDLFYLSPSRGIRRGVVPVGRLEVAEGKLNVV